MERRFAIVYHCSRTEEFTVLSFLGRWGAGYDKKFNNAQTIATNSNVEGTLAIVRLHGCVITAITIEESYR